MKKKQQADVKVNCQHVDLSHIEMVLFSRGWKLSLYLFVERITHKQFLKCIQVFLKMMEERMSLEVCACKAKVLDKSRSYHEVEFVVIFRPIFVESISFAIPSSSKNAYPSHLYIQSQLL